jgi:hypothetical protein
MERTGTHVAGWALVGSAAAALLAMSHHPTHLGQGALSGWVHGVLIALSAVIAYGFLHWSRLRGLDRPAVAAALVAYGVALFGGIGAATINGFVLPAFPHGHGGGEAHQLAGAANQALAYLGVVATGAAYALWSLDLLRPRGTRAEKLVGAVGLVAALVPLALLAAGVLRMNMAGALIVYGSQWAWMALVGLLMIAAGRRAA